MARIAGVDLPKEKRVEIGLTYIYGIGVAFLKKKYIAAMQRLKITKSKLKNTKMR